MFCKLIYIQCYETKLKQTKSLEETNSVIKQNFFDNKHKNF